MEFLKYQHLERFGTIEVEKIETGECYVFPKIDGTNSSLWLNEDGILQAGSRKRHLTLDNDNAGFYAWAMKQENILAYLKEHPSHRLFGEWLVPHSLKTYKTDAWNKFYVFDVCIDKEADEILHEGDSKLKYLHFETYKPLLEKFEIGFIPPICKISDASYEDFVEHLMKNVFLIEEGKGIGEGIVIKNYAFRNKYNRQVFAKIVTSEFKEKHEKKTGSKLRKGSGLIEELIAEEFVTTALCEKVHAKIVLENEGWSSKFIPRLLNTIYYDLITEDCWNIVKKYKQPTINFKTLQYFVFNKAKAALPKVFGE